MLLRRPHELAGLLRDGRARAGWSQSQLAEKVGVSRQWISLVETGKTSVEFDLAVGVLQALGYQLRVESSGGPTQAERQATDSPPAPTHPRSQRTPLTRQGEPLSSARVRRRPKEDRRE
jgi:y4mF family transcriptional regulator